MTSLYGQNYLNWYLNQPDMYNMGGCGMFGCGYGSDYSLGTILGMTGVSIFGQILSGVVNRNSEAGGVGDGSYTPVSTQTEKDIEAQLAILNKDGKSYSIDDFSAATVEDKYTEAVSKAEANKNAVEVTITTDKNTLSAKKSDLATKKSELANKTDKTSPEYYNLEQAIKDLEKEIAKLEKKIEDNEAKISDDGELGKALKQAEDAKTAREEEINAAISQLNSLKTQLNAEQHPELSASELDELLDGSDGNWIERKTKGARGDMMQKIREFRKAKLAYDSIPNNNANETSKTSALQNLKKMAGEIKTFYSELSTKDSEKINNDRTVMSGYEAIQDWLNQN